MLSFTRAAAADLPRIVAIYNQTIPGRMVTADLEPVTVEARIPWFEKHTDRYPLTSVFCDGVLCAWYGFQPYHPRAAYAATAEVSIYIDESCRGRGIGTAILTQALTHAEALGYENVVGLIFGHNLPSLRLFEKFGFARWGHLPGIARLDDVARDLVIVGKKLQ